MNPFTLIHAADQREAIKEASGTGTKFIAGGTNLLDLMKVDVEQPEKLVNITGLDLGRIEELKDGGILIGALVSNTDIAYHPLIKTRYPVLSQAILAGASAQLRNMATAGGNLLQRTRCPYFYNNTFPCNKREPGTGCSAIKGYNRTHAILGISEYCIATHPSDMAVALVVLDAVIHTEGADGKRSVPITEFHLPPGNTPHIESVLKQGELITGVEIPAIPYATRSQYIKVRDRASYEFALTSAAVVLDINGNTIRTARIALGGIGTKPWRALEAEKVLEGRQLSKQSYIAAAEAALIGAKPHKYNAFKPELARRTLVHALQTIGGES